MKRSSASACPIEYMLCIHKYRKNILLMLKKKYNTTENTYPISITIYLSKLLYGLEYQS